MPDHEARTSMIESYLKDVNTSIKKDKKALQKLGELTENLSSSDIKSLTWQAAMTPLKELDPAKLLEIDKDEIREVTMDDFIKAHKKFIPSYDANQAMEEFEEWGRANKE